jgi:hypothetical protein
MDTLEQAGVEMDPEELEHMQTMGTPIHINIHCILDRPTDLLHSFKSKFRPTTREHLFLQIAMFKPFLEI